MKKMDQSEQLVEAHLRRLGFASIVHEPDGNVTPDFLCDGRIAVEVRRLNQNFDDGTEVRGLEEVSMPLKARMRKLLASMGSPTTGKSWFVFHDFERPIQDLKALLASAEDKLRDFMTSPIEGGAKFELTRNFSIDIRPASHPSQFYFMLGGFIDHDSGGWLLGELEQNLKVCIADKTKKIAPYRHKYPEWWLAFVDHVGWGLSDFDIELFKDQITIEHGFDRVIVLHPSDPARAFSL